MNDYDEVSEKRIQEICGFNPKTNERETTYSEKFYNILVKSYRDERETDMSMTNKQIDWTVIEIARLEDILKRIDCEGE